MKKVPPPASPDAYVESITGWRRQLVDQIRGAVRATSILEEVIKWGHLVYFHHGPVLLIRAEDERVLFGFWRGQRLVAIEPRLKKGGKYEMATIDLREGMTITPAIVRELTREAIALNQSAGNPAKLAPAKTSAAKKRTAKKPTTQKPAVKKSAARKSVSTKSARKKPAAKKRVTKKKQP
jgi:hypothetical protein